MSKSIVGSVFVCLILMSVAAVARAETFTWKGGSGTMTSDGSWTGGVAPVFTNATGTANDIVFPTCASIEDSPEVTMATAKVLGNDYYFKSLTGSKQYRLYLPYWGYSYAHSRVLHIGDPSAFYGTFSVFHTTSHNGPYSPWLHVTSDDPAKRVLHRVIADGRLRFVADAETVLKVENPIGLGFFDVGEASYPGTVELMSSPGGRSHVNVLGGTLRLHGNAAPDLGPVAGAWVHLDASKTASMTLDENGRVAEWRDADGNGEKATKHGNSWANPELKTDAVSGKRVVDFGGFGASFSVANTFLGNQDPNEYAKYGVPCAMTFADEHQVKELFVVYREHTRMNARPLWVGVDYAYNHSTLVPLVRARDANKPGQLFQTTDHANPLHWAEIRLDGQRVTPDYRDDCTERLHVLSVGFDGESTAVKNIAFGRDSAAFVSFGGLQIAEILMYTNALSAAERRQTNAYLKRKWLPKTEAADWDLGRIALNDANCKVEVADGTAAIRELALPAGTKSVTKSGAGDLIVDRVLVGNVLTNLPVKVESGNLWFSDHQGEVKYEMAPDPDVWLDAANMTESSFLASNDVEYVTQWKDCRTGGLNNRGERVTADRYAYAGRVAAYATRQTVTINGVEKTIVDFGKTSTNNLEHATAAWDVSGQDSAAYRINYNGSLPAQASYTRQRDCFIVIRKKDSKVAVWSEGTTSLYDFYSSTTWRFYTRGFCNIATEGAVFEVNGKVVDGSTDANGLNATDFFVVSFAAGGDAPVTGLACNRGQYNFGGQQIAEVLFYDRPLSAAEHRNTTAYLMRKWLGKDHPEDHAATDIPTVDVPVGQDAVIGSDEDVTVGQVFGGDGAFIKRGAGDVTVNYPISSASFRSIEVEDGALTVGVAMLGGAYFQLNTSDWQDTMTITNGDDDTQWVTEWRDPRGNGKFARPYYAKYVRPGVSPQLVDVTIGGKAAKALTCGPGLSKDVASNLGEDGYFTEEKGAKTSAMDWFDTDAERKTYFAESYVVHARRDTSSVNYLFGMPNYDGNSWSTNINDRTCTSCYPFMCNSGSLSRGDLGAAVYYGEMYVDDDDTNVTGAWKGHDQVDQFHLFCSVPLGKTWIGGFGRRENYEIGGSKWVEAAVFTSTNSVVARNRIRSYLYNKWFGDGVEETTYDRLAVHHGGMLSLTGKDGTTRYRVEALAGVGEISVNHPVVGVGTLALEGHLAFAGDLGLEITELPVNFRSADDYDRLSVDGELTLPAACAVTVTSDALKRLPFGSYPILTAETLTGDISGWTLDATGLKKVVASLSKVGNSVVLTLSPVGMAILIR